MSDLVARLRKEIWISKGIAECEARDFMQEAADRIEALEDQVTRCAGFLENLPHQGALEGPAAFMIKQCRELVSPVPATDDETPPFIGDFSIEVEGPDITRIETDTDGGIRIYTGDRLSAALDTKNAEFFRQHFTNERNIK